MQRILELANGLTIQETNYLIKKLNKAKIKIEEGVLNAKFINNKASNGVFQCKR